MKQRVEAEFKSFVISLVNAELCKSRSYVLLSNWLRVGPIEVISVFNLLKQAKIVDFYVSLELVVETLIKYMSEVLIELLCFYKSSKCGGRRMLVVNLGTGEDLWTLSLLNETWENSVRWKLIIEAKITLQIFPGAQELQRGFYSEIF